MLLYCLTIIYAYVRKLFLKGGKIMKFINIVLCIVSLGFIQHAHGNGTKRPPFQGYSKVPTSSSSQQPSARSAAPAAKPALKNYEKLRKDGNSYYRDSYEGDNFTSSTSATKAEYDEMMSNQTRNKYTKTLGGRLGGIAFNVSTAVKNFFTISPEFKAQSSQVLSSVGNKITGLFLPSSATGKNSAKVTPLADQE